MDFCTYNSRKGFCARADPRDCAAMYLRVDEIDVGVGIGVKRSMDD